MNEDKMLPLVPCECGLVGNEYCAGCDARRQQRDADWERVKPLVEAARDSLKWPALMQDKKLQEASRILARIDIVLAQLAAQKP